ncbi:MAG: hypothetical protein OK455_08630 [Thaumarchaeota archaeon]|nr:hypothetical protein [Nitrososphaerota archaeon]
MMAMRQLSFDKLLETLVRASYVAALVVLLAALSLTFQGRLWVAPLGGISSVSVGSVSVLYALSDYRFKSAGITETKSFVLGILFSNAFLHSYEIINNVTFGVLFTGTEARMLVLWLVMMSPLLLVREQLQFRWTSAVLLLALASVWAAWVLYGFPQYYLQRYPLPRVLDTSDPYHLSLWFNFVSKAILAGFYASMLAPLNSLKRALAFVASRSRPV